MRSRPAPATARARRARAICLASLLTLLLAGCEEEPRTRPPARTPTSNGVPTIEVAFPDSSPDQLFGPRRKNGDHPRLAAVYREPDGVERTARASLRGFSKWHHGRAKPSLRLRPHGNEPGTPRAIELTRPEDALALCNWLPNQLVAGFGLLHDHSQHVRMVLAGVDRGIYLRSLRPGDALAAANGRARGRWFKGDCLGDRSHLDLWAESGAWRALGPGDPAADRALADLLQALRAPVSVDSGRDLAQTLDLDRTARMHAVAVLVGSIHADRGHNHVLFFDPATARLEPVLWDANGFGIHVEPEVPVETIRHPLADRLACDPEFIDRRNRYLHDLLRGAGSADALLATARATLARLAPAFATDPEIGSLRLHFGRFRIAQITAERLPQALGEFEHFVRRRHAMLRRWFADARVALEDVSTATAKRTRVTVFGNVAVLAHDRNGATVTRPDGTSVNRLLPGLSEPLTEFRQHPSGDRRGIEVFAALPAPLSYVLAAAPEDLRFTNPFTATAIEPRPIAEVPNRPGRSLHPWHAETPPALVQFGPGTVAIHRATTFGPTTMVRIAPATDLVLRAPLRCEGGLEILGTATAPVRVRITTPALPSDHLRAGIHCVASNVTIRHAQLFDQRPWQASVATPSALLTLGNCCTTISDSRFENGRADLLTILGGRADVWNVTFQNGYGAGLHATAGAELQLLNVDIAGTRHGVLAKDGARVHWRNGRLLANRHGVLARRSSAPMPPAGIELHAVACELTAGFDIDCGPGSAVAIFGSTAIGNPRSAGNITIHPGRKNASQAAAPPR